MKTIIALLLALFFTATSFAADRRPTVTLNSNRNFEIVIDGQRYSGNNNFVNISNLRNGRHTIRVYEFRRGLFGNNRRLISSKNFLLKNNDLSINVDRNGEVQIYEEQYGRGRNNGWGSNDDRNYNKGYGNDRDKDWNDGNNNGRGKDKDWNDSNRGRNKGY